MYRRMVQRAIVLLSLCLVAIGFFLSRNQGWTADAPAVADQVPAAKRPKSKEARPAKASAGDELKQGDDGKYKRRHTRVMEFLIAKDIPGARKRLDRWMKVDPKDPENFYMLSVIECQAGNVPAAVVAMQRAVDLGLPPIRFVAGKETLLDPLKGTAEFKKLAAPFDHKIVAGPMLGVVTDTSAKVWVRTAKPAKVQVSYRPMNTKARSQLAASVQSKLEDDCVAVVTLENLRAGETYHYDVVVDGAIDPVLAASQQFTTAPKDGSRAKFSVAFGGCAGYTPANERMWDTIRGFNLSALWLLGDNVYSDAPEWPAIQNYCFYRRQARPEFRRLTASTPTYAIYDDHDFGANDCSGGPEIEKPAWKRQVWNLFRNTWLNPSYGGGEKQPGCWFDYQYGDVHFIFLDGRYYRANEKHAVNPPTMLGPVQKEWLLKTIGESKSKIKVLISPVTWALGTKGESPDTWHGYQEERQEIMDFLAEKKISGVVLVSSDRHRTDLLRNDRKNGYPIFEFNSGLLTNDSAHPRLATAEFSYNDLPTFGMIDFDTVSPEASVTYRIIDILGREHLKFTVFESELK